MFFNRQKNELKVLKKQYQEIREKEMVQRKEIREIRDKEKELNFLKGLLKQYTILGIEKNKLDVEYYVCLSISEDTFDLYLKSAFTRRHPVPRLFGTIHPRSSMNNIGKCKIDDMNAVNENEGNGSILLDYAKKYLKSIGIRYIYGDLSSVDKDKFGKLEKFYMKNSFEVTFNEERTSGRIKINI